MAPSLAATALDSTSTGAPRLSLSEASTRRWVVHRAGAPSPRLRLWCFPHAGGSAAAYRSWAQALPGGVELCPLEPPGHGTRFAEPGLTRMEAITEAVADAIQPELEVPFVFFGHSLGGAVAFEVARELRRRGLGQPRRLVVSARPMPRAPIAKPPIYHLPTVEFGEAVQRKYGVALPQVSDPRLLQTILLTMRADIEMHETYLYREEPRLSCALSAWAGARDPLAPPGEMEGWRDESEGPFELRTFAGGHFYQRTEERRVLQGLGELLEEAMAPVT